MAERKPNIRMSDITEEMQNDAVEVAQKAMDAAGASGQVEQAIALHIKREFDKKHNPTWQCVVGRKFTADVHHEAKHFIYFYLGQLAILLWKAS